MSKTTSESSRRVSLSVVSVGTGWLFTTLIALGLSILFFVLLKSAEKRVSFFFENEANNRALLLINQLNDEFYTTNSLNMLFESQEVVLSHEFHIFTSEVFSNNYCIVSFYYSKPDYSTQKKPINKFSLQRMGLNPKEDYGGLTDTIKYSLPVLFLNSKSFSIFPKGCDLRSIEELADELDEAIRSRSARFSKKVTIKNEGITSDYIFIISPHFEIDSLGTTTEKFKGISIAQISLDKVFYEAISQTPPKNIYTEMFELDENNQPKLMYSWKPRAQDEVSLFAELFNFTVSPHFVRRTIFGREILIQMNPGTTFVGKYFPNSLPIIFLAFIAITVLFHMLTSKYIQEYNKGKAHFVEAEKEIIEKEKRYSALFNSISDMVFIANGTTGMLTEANEAAREFTGYSAEEITKTHFSKLHPPDEQHRIIPEFAKTTNGISQLFETKIISKSGKIIPIEINAVKAIIIDKEQYLVGIFRDISVRKTVEEELKKINLELENLNKRKDRFLSIIAHDMINPFSGIMGFSEHIVEDYESMSDNEVIESVARVVQAANQAYRLLENLLRWAKLQFSESDIIFTDVNIEELIATVVKGFSLPCIQKKIHIQPEIQSGLRVMSDPDTLSFILRNLIANAIKFSIEGSVIEVTATRLKDDKSEVVKISVTDYGVGMSQEQQNNLFSGKELLSTRGTLGEKGTGLGLKLCFEFAERLHGNITVESELGKGTTISLLLG